MSQPKAKASKVNKAVLTATPAAAGNGGLSCVALVPLVIVFFCAGIFVGSLFLESSHNLREPAGSIPTVGLPGTNNKFIKWANAVETLHLRTAPAKVLDTIQQRSAATPGSESADQKDTHYLKGPPIVPAVNNIATGGATLSRQQIMKRSLHATQSSYLTAPPTLDNPDILVGAWIYMDASGADNDMRTVFSNKMPGCDKRQPQYGLSLFVNAWQQSDHKLYVEYGGTESGCHKLDSASVELKPEQWYHVAVYTNPHHVSLYIDGELVNSEEVADGHQVQRENSLLVGVYDRNGDYPFAGNISHFAVVHDVEAQHTDVTSTVKQLMDLSTISHTQGLVALYTLIDASSETVNSEALEIVNNKAGKYTFPVHRSSAPGVKIRLVDGVGGRPVTDEMRAESDAQGRIRRESLKAGMKHAWAGYKKYAWGRDEVKPLSNRGQDNWGGMGVTLVDSLDTLWLMGMKEEFAEAREWVAKSLTFDHAGTVSVFETTIRELGGLLSAYDMSQDEVFLQKARQLADKLMPAFNTPSGIPHGMVNFRSGEASGGWSGSNAILSELGSLQIEFRYLAQAVKEASYEHKAMRPFQVMYAKHPATGLYPIKVSNRDGAFADSQITFGALGDSFYEYLLKTWLQGGRKETWLREMYDKAMDGVMDHLLLASDVSGLAFLADWNGRYNNRKMDHLVCFMPGALALGAYTDPLGLDSARAKRDLAVAKALMYTCYQMYHRMTTGIAAEYVEFPAHADFVPGASAQFYILRPETAESMFILNKLTGDPIYRDWAWEIWQAIDRTCKTPTAYGAIRNVNQKAGGGIDDRMESFFLAETMKYLYLAQDPDTEIDLMKVVFNTEAHPMKILDASHIPIASS